MLGSSRSKLFPVDPGCVCMNMPGNEVVKSEEWYGMSDVSSTVPNIPFHSAGDDRRFGRSEGRTGVGEEYVRFYVCVYLNRRTMTCGAVASYYYTNYSGSDESARRRRRLGCWVSC